MFNQLHPYNLVQLKAHIRQFGATYFHGDGNFYSAAPVKDHNGNEIEHPSDIHQKYVNPKQEDATYRVKLSSVDQVPNNLDEMQGLLIKAKEEEKEVARKAALTGIPGVVNVTEDDEMGIKPANWKAPKPAVTPAASDAAFGKGQPAPPPVVEQPIPAGPPDLGKAPDLAGLGHAGFPQAPAAGGSVTTNQVGPTPPPAVPQQAWNSENL